MASITFSLTCGKKDVQYYGGDTFSATMTRNEAPPENAVPKSAVLKFTNILVGTARNPYLEFGDYFTTGGLPQTSGEFLQVDISYLSSSILDVTSASMTVTIKGLSSSLKAFDFNSTSATLEVEYEISYGTSTGSLSSSKIEAGKSMTVTFSNSNLSTVSHKVTWTFGSHSNTVSASTGASSASYTIPVSWVDSIPNSTSGTGTVTLATYSGGSFVGSKQYNFTQTVPSSVVPTIGSITLSRIDDVVPDSWGDIFVQNRSGVALSATGASGTHGSTITSYTFVGSVTSETPSRQFFNSTQTTSSTHVSSITSSGTIQFSVYVTDSRGRKSSSATTSIKVTPYSSPVISSAIAYRCNENGESNEEGRWIGARAQATHFDLGGLNPMTVSCYYQILGRDEWVDGVVPLEKLGEDYIFGNGNIDLDYTYSVKFVAADTFTSVERIVDVVTSAWAIFFQRGGTGVGIGKIAEQEFTLDINRNWEILYGKYSLKPVIYSPTEPSDGYEGLIWLCPKE